VLGGLQAAARPYHAPTPEQCEAAAACATCQGVSGVPGVQCAHCKLDESVSRWEAKLYLLQAKSKHQNGVVAEADAVKAHHASVVAAQAGAVLPGTAQMRAELGVQGVTMTRKPNEHTLLLQGFVLLLKCVPTTHATPEHVGLSQLTLTSIIAALVHLSFALIYQYVYLEQSCRQQCGCAACVGQ
jgi:hypothetical protein